MIEADQSLPAVGNGAIASVLLQNQTLLLMLLTFGGMLLFLMAESLWPRRPQTQIPAARWINNWLLASLNFFALLWFSLWLASASWIHTLAPHNALLRGLHPAFAIPLLLLVVDLVSYAAHRLFHAVPVLWRLHAIHHLDTDMDVTTSHRHHTLEVLLMSLLMIPLLALLGATPAVMLSVMALRLTIVLFSHSNLYIPRCIDSWLRRLIVTPDFHRLHHASDRQFTNSNYSTTLPCWDQLFGTARHLPFDQHARLELGLEYLREPAAQRLDRLLTLPIIWQHTGRETTAYARDNAHPETKPHTSPTLER